MPIERTTIPADVLTAFGFERATAVPFERANVNESWKIEHSNGVAVLRKAHVSRLADPVAWEQALIAFAAAKEWPVPVALPARNGDTVFAHSGRLWTAAVFLDGTHAPQDRPSMHHILGRLLARLHNDLAGFDDLSQRPGVGKSWELDATVAATDLRTFNALLEEFGKHYPDVASAVRRYRYRNLRELSRLHYPELPEHPIHGDFQPWNLLFKDGNLSGLLDFDWCRRDALVADLAPAFCTYNPLDLRLAKAFLEGYESVRPLAEEEWRLLPALVRAELLRFIAFRLVEWRLLGSERSVGSITRTATVRLPLFDETEQSILDLRRTVSERR